MPEATEWNELFARGQAVSAGDPGAYERLWSGLQPVLERWLASPSFLGRISEDREARRDVLVIAWEKLQDNGFARLRSFFERSEERKADRDPGARFRSFLFRVVKNIGIDYVRSLPEHIRLRKPKPKTKPTSETLSSVSPASTAKHWHSIVSLSGDEAGARDPITIRNMARQILEFLDATVPDRLRRAHALYEAGHTPEQIAGDLKLKSPADAERVVTRAQDRLLYRAAIELWSQGYSDTDIAGKLELDDAKHAHRIINAAKEHFKRHYRPSA